MPPPPPPPAPLGGPKVIAPSKAVKGPPDRGALLASIEKGAKLKKVTTNDRSAPLVDGE